MSSSSSSQSGELADFVRAFVASGIPFTTRSHGQLEAAGKLRFPEFERLVRRYRS